jgi:hypothetical protein
MKLMKNFDTKFWKRVIRRLALIIVMVYLSQFMLQAQITIESSDMPSQGDTVRLSTSMNPDFSDYTDTGEDFFWDFSDMIAAYQTVDTFVSPMETPPIYQLFFALSSNLANRYLRDLPIPDFELSDIFYFYKNSDSKFTNVGFAASINGIPLPIKFDNPDVWYRFPLEYGNVDSSASHFEFGVDNFGYVLIDRTRKNTVDGWGTVTTPFGTFDVLRIKSDVHEFDSIYVDSLQMGIPLDRYYTEYKWMAKDQKEPVVQITSDFTGGLVVTYRDSVRAIYEAVDENLFANRSLTVYPNPVEREFQVEFELSEKTNTVLILYDIAGRKIYTEQIVNTVKGLNKKTVSLQKAVLKEGAYVLEIRAGAQRLRGKIIVRK